MLKPKNESADRKEAQPRHGEAANTTVSGVNNPITIHGNGKQLPVRVYREAKSKNLGPNFHEWLENEPFGFRLVRTDYPLGNGDIVNLIVRDDNGEEELVGVNKKLQERFEEEGLGYYLVTFLGSKTSATTKRNYNNYYVEFGGTE